MDLGWSLGSCGRALYVCMKAHFERPAISKIRAVVPNLVAVATFLSRPIFLVFTEFWITQGSFALIEIQRIAKFMNDLKSVVSLLWNIFHYCIMSKGLVLILNGVLLKTTDKLNVASVLKRNNCSTYDCG